VHADAQSACMADASPAEAKSLASQAVSVGRSSCNVGAHSEAVADQTCIVHMQGLDVKNGLQDDTLGGAVGWRCLGRGTPSLPSHA